MARSKICDNCNTRPTTPESPEGSLCSPCYDEAGWENTHSDFGHAGLAAIDLDAASLAELKEIAKRYGLKLNRTQRTRPTIAAEIATYRTEKTANCWVCRPELNKASEAYTPRSGTSRAGMTLHVPIRASGIEKAEHVAALLGTGTAECATKVQTSKGRTTLKVTLANGTVELLWDAQGHYLYADSTATVDGKSRKVRNVAEALRLVAA